MSIFDTSFQTQESDADMMQPSDHMGPDSIENYQGAGGGLSKGSATRSLVLLWFACLVAKWILAYVFRGNIRG